MNTILLSLVMIVAVSAANDDKTQAVLRQIMKEQLDVIKHCVGLRGYPYKSIPYPHGPHKYAPIAFHVRSKNTLKNVPSGKKVIFDTVDVNEGGGYKSSDGIFTAPKSGLYVFSWTTVTAPGKRFITEFIVGGHLKGINHNAAEGSTSWQPGSQMVVVYMRKFQAAWLKIHGNQGQVMRGWYWSTFSGYLLSPLN